MKVYLVKWSFKTDQAPTPWIYKKKEDAENKRLEMIKSWGISDQAISLMELELR